jgi:hypothetical protein
VAIAVLQVGVKSRRRFDQVNIPTADERTLPGFVEFAKVVAVAVATVGIVENAFVAAEVASHAESRTATSNRSWLVSKEREIKIDLLAKVVVAASTNERNDVDDDDER